MATIKYRYNNQWNTLKSIKVSDYSIPEYTGSYVVTPQVYANNELLTKDRRMKDNITVNKISQLEVSNLSDGFTLIIGEESLNG